jgi:hypothetical protein
MVGYQFVSWLNLLNRCASQTLHLTVRIFECKHWKQIDDFKANVLTKELSPKNCSNVTETNYWMSWVYNFLIGKPNLLWLGCTSVRSSQNVSAMTAIWSIICDIDRSYRLLITLWMTSPTRPSDVCHWNYAWAHNYLWRSRRLVLL